ncbi:DUF1289 domain-containing protein [Falsochrobactrum shanghaiense]|uniref:DUF1289 domain-containing protein n=1 Tax=Falsochrobactrum shanghaiense TaxID=2201899 RepID=A0A316JBI9_9HYPH|nr:DUF1289 domain-containing protein [Falsochrobactrum shanghaiense]PWL18025.1 DUF1289 domain-containing protein [Falsochrobactrum shanghaiense]
MDKAAIESPCILVCTIDQRTGLCLGCVRTLDEIARWSGMGDHERQAVLALLPERRQQMEEKEG